MGNIIARVSGAYDVTRRWPQDYANKRHWCYEWRLGTGAPEHYCDDAKIGGTRQDLNFDYTVFQCRYARCQTCLDLNRNLYPPRELWKGDDSKIIVDSQSREIHVTWKGLTESSCEFCSVLQEGINSVAAAQTLIPESVFCLELLEGFTVRATHEVSQKQHGGTEDEKLVAEFYSNDSVLTPSTWQAFGPAGRVKKDIDVSECTAFVNRSIQECLKHAKCVSTLSSGTTKLPTRLIDVGGDENSVRLEMTPIASERYIALTHVWGKLPLTTTTISNLADRCQNIPWESLTKTFQDSIRLTRGLGIRYLWIDSLCIIQDLPSDWRTEAKHMAQVYSNSYLTLAATSAAESSQGLLRPRYNLNVEKQPEDLCEYEIRQDTDTSKFSIYARQAPKYSHKFLQSLEYKGGLTELAPLLYRAWALQERLLSPRILHFSFDEMVWVCKEGSNCECGFLSSLSGKALSSGPLGIDIFRELLNDGVSSDLQTSDQTYKSEFRKDLFIAWYHLVEYFMALDITFPSDRLPAVRGLARLVEEKLGWTYLEGIWVEDCVAGLLWSVDWIRDYWRDESIPSWSWASIRPSTFATAKNFTQVPHFFNVLSFITEKYVVHSDFHLVSHSADLSDDGVENCHSIEGHQQSIVLEAAFIEAIIVLDEPSDSGLSQSLAEVTPAVQIAECERQETNSSKEEEQDVNVKAQTAKVSPEVIGPRVPDDPQKNDKPKPGPPKLVVKGTTSSIQVSLDVRERIGEDLLSVYGEVSNGGEVLAILILGGEFTGPRGLVLKRVDDEPTAYKRIGCFFLAAGEEKYFVYGTQQVVII